MNENALYYGDNLEILREYIRNESVDLVYLDPPFKRNKNYNVIFEEKNGSASTAQIKAFEDTWRWDQKAAKTFQEIVEKGEEKVSKVLQAFRMFLGSNDMLAYLTMMAPRLIELRRVLKPTGSIYLHCDPAISHYLKILMDAVFGVKNFRNEIVWCYTGPSNTKAYFPRKHDTLLFYVKDNERAQFFPNAVRVPYAKSLKAAKARTGIFASREYPDLDKRIKMYDKQGKIIEDWWSDITPVGRKRQEILGYPTQKPEALLERIIKASTKEGDIVLDPFCGCGTAIVAAEKLHRRWIGIDITCLAINLIKRRLVDSFGEKINTTYKVIGEPTSLSEAEALFKQDHYQFQWWALDLVGARPVEEKKGADKGIDGRIYFHDEPEKTRQIILQVKGGRVNAACIRDLRGTIEREQAEIGVLITLKKPTKAMYKEANEAGYYYSSTWNKHYPRLQIITIEELLNGKKIDYPAPKETNVTFKKAPRRLVKKTAKQEELF